MYAACAQHHIPSPFSNVISLCQSPEVDLVSVVTPPYLHAEQMIGALNIGTFMNSVQTLVSVMTPPVIMQSR